MTTSANAPMSIRRLVPGLGLALLLVGGPAARAECVCTWGGPFTRVQGATDLVVSGTVVAMRGNSIDLEIDRVLRGTVYTDWLRIWLDIGDSCRAPTGSFPLDTQWVMALDRIDERVPGGFNPHTPNVSYGRVGDYSLSRCGGYWLSQAENLVSGNLYGGTRWDMEPKMSPVLLELVEGFVRGELDEQTLKEAGAIDPALQELMHKTRIHLRR